MVCAASEDVEPLFSRALDELLRKGYLGDTSFAERYLLAVLEEQPTHLEAQWQLVRIELAKLESAGLSERAAGLAAIAPTFAELAQQAKQSDQVFLHYITAMYADKYHAYERALSEIDKALASEPESPRYSMGKGRLLVNYGQWSKQDREIEEGIGLLLKAKRLSKTHPNPYAREMHYDFQIAWGIAKLSKPRWDEVVEHYVRFIEQSEESIPYAYAWNNVSIAYRKLGQCGEAKEAAENALKVMTFSEAESNKRYAEFCIEMQKMGIMGGE